SNSLWQSEGFAPGSLGDAKSGDFAEVQAEGHERVDHQDHDPGNGDGERENRPAGVEVGTGVPCHRDQEQAQRYIRETNAGNVALDRYRLQHRQFDETTSGRSQSRKSEEQVRHLSTLLEPEG